MYLVSVYFDKATNHMIQSYISLAAKRSGNDQMLKGEVPPHITISSFETREEEKVIECLEEAVSGMRQGTLQVASIGAFPSNALFLAPVLNEYLHVMSDQVYNKLAKVDEIKISRYYQPFSWMPHLTIAKNLTPVEMVTAFEAVQKEFSMFRGQIVAIGLAKTKPYHDIVRWELNENTKEE